MNISGMFNQNIARHPAVWVSRPPNNGPTLKPSIKNPLQAPIYTARRCGVAPVPTAASVLGTAKAAENPAGPVPPTTRFAARQGYDTGCDAEQCQASH